MNRCPSTGIPDLDAAARAPVAIRVSSVCPASSRSSPAQITRARPAFGKAPPPATRSRNGVRRLAARVSRSTSSSSCRSATSAEERQGHVELLGQSSTGTLRPPAAAPGTRRGARPQQRAGPAPRTSAWRHYPLVPPAVRPETRWRWAKKNTMPAGIMTRPPTAVRYSHCGLNCGTNCCSPYAEGEVAVGLDERRGVRDLAPGGEEGVERGDREARPGQRQDDPPERRERAAAVDRGRLVERRRDGVEVARIIHAQNGTAMVQVGDDQRRPWC